jgi:hypothetical protein
VLDETVRSIVSFLLSSSIREKPSEVADLDKKILARFLQRKTLLPEKMPLELRESRS